MSERGQGKRWQKGWREWMDQKAGQAGQVLLQHVQVRPFFFNAAATPEIRPPSSRWAPNGRAALGPSVSPHVAPPRAVLPLAVAGPSGPAPLCLAGQTAPPRGAGSEVNGLE